MEPIIVVSGKQSTLPQKNKILWIDYLIFMNTLFYMYTLVMNDYSRTSDFVIFSIFYGLIGLYLPLYGRKCLEENKSTNVFTTCQGVLSAYHFLIHCGNIAVFYTFNNLCHKCLDTFKTGEENCKVEWAHNNINLNVHKCFQMPNEDDFMFDECLYILIAIIGMVVTLKVSVNKKEDIVEAIQVSDPEIISRVLMQLESGTNNEE